MKCAKCGSELPDKVSYCPYCGQKISKYMARAFYPRFIWGIVISFLIVVALLGGMTFYSYYQNTHLPSFIGLTSKAAIVLTQKYGLPYRIVTDTSNYEKDTVFEQSHSKETPVDSVDELVLTVSLGPPVAVPDVTNLDEQYAISELSTSGFSVGEIEYVYSSTVDKGKIVKTIPEATELTTPGAQITLQVSKGEKIILPDLEGESFEKAKDVLLELGLLVAQDKEYSDTIPEGCVVRIKPYSYAFEEGDEVTVFVSLGKGTTVPKVTNKTEQEAIDELHQAGFYNISVIYEETIQDSVSGYEGKVTRQSLTGKANLTDAIELSVEKPFVDIRKVNFSVNYVGGVDVTISFKNTGNKVINYINVEMAYYNRVGDPARCDIYDTHIMTLNYTGPLDVGEQQDAYWDATIYNSATACLWPKKITLIFQDGERQTIHNNTYWYSSDYAGGSPKN